jgi:hypothetical protein
VLDEDPEVAGEDRAASRSVRDQPPGHGQIVERVGDDPAEHLACSKPEKPSTAITASTPTAPNPDEVSADGDSVAKLSWPPAGWARPVTASAGQVEHKQLLAAAAGGDYAPPCCQLRLVGAGQDRRDAWRCRLEGEQRVVAAVEVVRERDVQILARPEVAGAVQY